MKNNGRSHKHERYFAVPHYILQTFAWRQLSVQAKAAWLQIGACFNGSNNGRIAVSCRDLANQLNISRPSAARAIIELLTFGFLERTQASSFSQKRVAAEYRLTHLPCDRTGELATRAFQNIKEQQNDQFVPPKSGSTAPNRRVH